MVGTRSQSAKKTETKSDVVMHDQAKSDTNRDESNERIRKTVRFKKLEIKTYRW
jgi:hypothetical protein